MYKKMREKVVAPACAAELPSGGGGGGVAALGEDPGEGEEVLRLICNFWPKEQWLLKEQRKNCWGPESKVKFAGPFVWTEIGLLALHGPKF